MSEFAKTVSADPDASVVVAFTGGSGNPTNTGRMFVSLKPLGERKASADQVIDRLRGKLARVPGAALFLQAVQDLRIGGRQSNAQYQYTLQSNDLADLNRFAPRMLAKLRELRPLRDVATDQQNRGLMASLVIDRDTASRFGILPQTIDETLYDAFGQRQVSTIFAPLNQYRSSRSRPPSSRIPMRSRASTSSRPRARRGRSTPSRASSRAAHRSPSLTRASSRR
jgi:multidrug efflux pump